MLICPKFNGTVESLLCPPCQEVSSMKTLWSCMQRLWLLLLKHCNKCSSPNLSPINPLENKLYKTTLVKWLQKATYMCLSVIFSFLPALKMTCTFLRPDLYNLANSTSSSKEIKFYILNFILLAQSLMLSVWSRKFSFHGRVYATGKLEVPVSPEHECKDRQCSSHQVFLKVKDIRNCKATAVCPSTK